MSLCITYEIVTPESAEHGDAAERGYWLPGCWHHDEHCTVTLREAVRCMGHMSASLDLAVYYETDGTTDYRTGAVETKALHVQATEASRERVNRILRKHRLIG